MAKESPSQLRQTLGSTFRFRFWLDFGRIQGFGWFIKGVALRLFVPKHEAPKESFEAAAKRFKLSDEEIEKRAKRLRRLSFFMIFLAILMVCYSTYQFTHGGLVGASISLLVMFIPIALAFRYHFWHYQLKQRKLGCTFKEWFKQGLLGGKVK